MRLATLLDDGRSALGIVREGRLLPVTLERSGVGSMRELAEAGAEALERLGAWADEQAAAAWRALDSVRLGPAVPDPGAIYAIGQNYRGSGERPEERAERPLVYGKLPTSVAAHGATLAWDHELTTNVDAEVELAIVIGSPASGLGRPASRLAPEVALDHVLGYTIVDDVSSRDPWLDGDQWLLGKSMAGFCPVGPWIVTRDELDPTALRLGCRIGGVPIQDGTTADMRFSIAEIVTFLGRHVDLRPGDLIATGTPARLAGPLGPERHLEPGDEVTAWIDGIGELTTRVA